MQIQRSGFLQHPVQFNQPHCHHGQISHHVILAQKTAHGAQHISGVGIARLHHLIKGKLGHIIPMPCVFKSFDLRLALLATRGFEQYIIIGVRIELRIKLNQINAFILDVFAQHIQIIAIVKRIDHLNPRIPETHKIELPLETANCSNFVPILSQASFRIWNSLTFSF